MALSDTLAMTATEAPPTKNALAQTTTPTRRYDRILVAAATVAAGTTILHIFGGGPAIADPILDSDLEETVRLTGFVVWHMVTVVLGFSAIALGLAAGPNRPSGSRPLVAFISALWIAFGLVFMAVSLTNGAGAELFFVELGQWVVLMPVGLLGLWSLRRSQADRG